MAQVVIYSTNTCVACRRAKQLLNMKGVPFTEIMVDEDEAQREEMIKRSGRKTVPQLFINGVSIGGSTDLYELERTGELDKLLGCDDPHL